MKLPNWVRVLWWLATLIVLTVLLAQRYSAFIAGETTVVDALAFVIWVALLLVPVFQEISIWGVSLKAEIKELKAEVKEQAASLRSEIQTSIDMHTNINPSFYLPAPPPDTQLPELEDQIKRALESALRDRGIEPAGRDVTQLAVPDDTALLFQARYNIEKEVRRLFSDRFGNDDDRRRRHTPVYRMAQALLEADLVDQRIARAIREVYSVASPALHGEVATPAQVAFVRDVAPEVIATLRAVR